MRKGTQAVAMKFSFWSGWSKRKEIDTAVVTAVALSAPASAQKTPADWRVAPPPAPVPVNPAVRAMEVSLALLVYRVTETLAKTELYFPASDLQVLGVSGDSAILCEEMDRKARALLHRTDVKHAERYVTQTAEIIAALHTTEHAALLLRLLCADSANAVAIPLIRRVADSCERVIRHSAKVLEAPAPDVFTWSNSVVAGQNEAQTAVYKAITLLGKEPALLTPAALKMARAAIWMMEVAADATAHAALECRGVVLPVPIVSREPQYQTNRYTSDSRHSNFAHV
ncbi:MAG: hypothetical protein H8F28_13820 [Fibrella sp.]|nr:hypothetical protein [Armatimonadota bacterium]